MRGVSQPPRDPRRPDPYRPAPGGPHGTPAQRYPDQGYPSRQAYPGQPGHAEQQGYPDLGRRPEAPYQEQRGQPRQYRPTPSRPRGRRVLGVGLVLAVLGALVLLVSSTLLPWVDGELSLPALLDKVTDIQSMSFGDWYVAIAGYPLVFLGILLSFAAVLESVAMKVIWVALTVLGLGYVAFRYGIGPLTGLVGESGGFSLGETAVAAGALVAIVVVLFVLKSAVGMFRRIAGLVLLGLSAVHITAIVDLVGANGFGELSAGAYGPALGYLLAGAAAFASPARLVPGR